MRAISLSLLVVVCGCEGTFPGAPRSTAEGPFTPGDVPGPRLVQAAAVSLDQAREAIGGVEAVAFARRIAPMLVGRTLNVEELARLSAGGGPAFREIVGGWTREPGFAEAARDFISVKLKTSGSAGGIDGDLPGNLAAYLVSHGRPHAELLTSTRCYTREGQSRACDTGAPFTAGVLTTRAFLKNTASRYNLKRARTVVKTFACTDFPMDVSLQPPVPRETLIPLFQVDQISDGSAGVFGNGFACYTCHSQFSAHAQVFVKFDDEGRYQPAATGLQDPSLEQGHSSPTLFTSHFTGSAAGSEQSQIFGRPVQHLGEAAEVIASSRLYLECTVRSFAAYVFGLSESEANALPGEVVEEAVSEALERSSRPSLASLVLEFFSHPSMIQARQRRTVGTP